MGKKLLITNSEDSKITKRRPALTPEAREDQMIALAVDLAEKQLREGTASSQVITHFLKLGSSREKLEQETIRKNQELIEAKKNSLASSQATEELLQEAIKAMKAYGGHSDDGDENNEPPL